MIDLHSHILFGLDDGAKNLEESVKMAQVAAKDGIEKIVGTPHLFRGNFVQKELSVIRQKKEELGQRLEDIGVDIELYTGAEVHISHDLMNEIRENREHLVIHNSSYMLIEFPSTHIFSGIKHLFFELMSEEIIPIIAHPERNSVFRENPALLYDLIEIGALAQANSGSFVGLYGRKTMEAVSQFLSWNFIHFIGSDAHSSRSLSPKLADAFFKVGEMIGEERAFALVWDNPQAVLRDEDIPYRYDPVYPNHKEKSIKIKIPNLFLKD